MIGSVLWSCLLVEVYLALKEGFVGSHGEVSEGPKVGTIAEFLGENISAVGVAGNVLDLDGDVLLLAFEDNLFSEVEMFEAFSCCCFGPVSECAVAIVDNGGQGDVRHYQIGGAVVEGNGVFDALLSCHNF